MANEFDLVIRGATIIAPHADSTELQAEQADVGIQNGKIAKIGSIPQVEAKTIDAKGLHLLPGAIDTQVHFRDPGFPDKEDLMSGTRAAIMGGVTAIFDMPNTNPPTLTALDLADKMSRAKDKAWCNYAFYMGASPENLDRLAELELLPGVCGVKMFMGSSTGNLVVGSDENIRRALESGHRRMAVHSEDEARLKERKKLVLEKPGHVEMHPLWRDEQSALLSTKKLMHLARKAHRKVHVLHITTAEEIEILSQNKDLATIEVTPQHLTLAAPDCYERLGTLAQMNPPIREARHQKALWQAVNSGIVDVLGSDHAPHTLAEKNKIYPETPSGMPGVQTILPLMLHHVNEGRLTLIRLVELLSQNPARIFGIQHKGEIREGFDADLALVDLKAQRTIQNSWIQSKCGWSPFAGMKLSAWVNATIIGGEIIMRDDQLVGRPSGKPLIFKI